MKKRLLTLLISSLFTLTVQAQVESTNTASHARLKNNLDVTQQNFYRGLRFEDWTASGLTKTDIKTDIKTVMQGKAVFFGKAGHCPDSEEASDYVINFLTQNI